MIRTMTGGRFVQPPKEDPYDAIINLVIDYKTVYGRVPDLIVCEEIPEQCQKTNTIKIDEKDILLCLAGKL